MPQPKTHLTTDNIRDFIPRYWTYVDVRGPDECWPWLGGFDSSGYGIFNVTVSGKRTMHKAHRFGFEIDNPPLVGDDCVLHSCDNPPCQNPAHWSRGTRSDNNADMRAKGRHYRVIPDETVRAMRAAYIPYVYGYGKIVREFGLWAHSPGHIYDILTGKYRKDVV